MRALHLSGATHPAYTTFEFMGFGGQAVRIAAIAFSAVALMSGPVLGADIARPVYKAPVVIPAYNWTGFYVGVHGGYGAGNADVSSAGFARSADIDGWFGGGQIGLNWQGAGSP